MQFKGMFFTIFTSWFIWYNTDVCNYIIKLKLANNTILFFLNLLTKSKPSKFDIKALLNNVIDNLDAITAIISSAS